MVNRMLSVFVAAAVMIGSAQLCFAALGETEKELIARYGKPFNEILPKDADDFFGDKRLFFKKDGVGVVATMRQGRSACENYLLMDEKGEYVRMSDAPERVAAILDANAPEGSWNPVKMPQFAKAWQRQDEQAYAYVVAGEEVLEVVTSEYRVDLLKAKLRRR